MIKSICLTAGCCVLLILTFSVRPVAASGLTANYQISDQEAGCMVVGTCPDAAAELAEAKLEIKEEQACANAIPPVVAVESDSVTPITIDQGGTLESGYLVTISYKIASGPSGHKTVCN